MFSKIPWLEQFSFLILLNMSEWIFIRSSWSAKFFAFRKAEELSILLKNHFWAHLVLIGWVKNLEIFNMSLKPSCLYCKKLILDWSTSFSMNKFNDASNVWHVHRWCFKCFKCNLPLTLDNAVLDDDTKELLCVRHHKKKPMPENCHHCGNICDAEKVERLGYFYHRVIKNLI